MWRFTGLAAPYDVVAHKSRKRWRFPPGATFRAGRVPLLREHDHALRIGRATPGPAGPRGLTVFGWSRSPVLVGMGLSIGFLPEDVTKEAGERVVRVAGLEEVSIVRRPAWPDCVITDVEEVISWPRTLAHT